MPDPCPKCGKNIVNHDECEYCGIVFEKYFQVEKRKSHESERVEANDKSIRNPRILKWTGFIIAMIFAAVIFYSNHSEYNIHSTGRGVVTPNEKTNSFSGNIEENQEGPGEEYASFQSSPELTPWTGEEDGNLEYDYYSANANPERKLSAILNEASPISKNGKVYYGYTKWRIDWHYEWKITEEGQFRISKVQTTLKCKVTLPKLSGATTKEQRDEFDRFLQALNVHEQGHLDYAKQASVEIEKRISSMAPMDSSESLSSAADAIGFQTLKEFNNRSDRYDLETGYGKTQGAYLD